MMCRITSLANTPGRSFAGDFDPANFRLAEASVCVARTSATWLVPMPKAIAPERPMRAGVAVAAGDRHSRLRQTLFGTDDMHDALPLVVEVEQPDAEIPAILFDGRHHFFRQSIRKRPQSGSSWE